MTTIAERKKLTSQQEGREYNKWFAYGQSKTANMLMALQLSRVLGSRGLLAFSLHPGLIMASGLGKHLDFSGKPDDDFTTLLAADRAMGNALGFGDNFSKLTNLTTAQGAATNVYAAFEPTLKGKSSSHFLHSSAELRSGFFGDMAESGLTQYVTPDHNGAYLEQSRLADPFKDVYRSWARDPIDAEMLWRASEKMVGQEFRY